VTRDELAKSLGYENEAAWDKRLADPEYKKYLSECVAFIGKCYAEGHKAYEDALRREESKESF
jgi:hypothetical protein